jgi:hypothetical protein
MTQRMTASLQQSWEYTLSPDRYASMNVAIGWMLCGELTPAEVQRALHAVIARHEVLRSVVTCWEAEVVQVVVPRLRPKLAVLDISSVRPGRRGRAIQRRVLAQLRRPFRLDRLPQIRPTLVRVGPGQHLLLLVVSHTVWDAASERIFLRDFGSALRQEHEPDRRPLDLHVGDYAEWLAHTEPLPASTRHCWRGLTAWRSGVRHAEPTALSNQSIASSDLPTIPGWCVSRMRGAAAHAATTPAVALAVVVATLNFFQDHQTQQVVGLSRDSRDRPELEPLIGYLLEYVPIPLEMDLSSSFHELLARAGAAVRRLHADDVSMARIFQGATCRWSVDTGSASEITINPVPVDVMPATAQLTDALTALPFRPSTWWSGHAHGPVWEYGAMNITFSPSGGRALAGRMCFNAQRVARESVERLARRFGVLVRLLALRTHVPLEQISRLVDAASRPNAQAYSTPSRPSGLLAHRPEEVA